MRKAITLFPVLTEELLSQVQFKQCDLKFSYYDENRKEWFLSHKKINDIFGKKEEYVLSDENERWNSNEYDLKIVRDFKIENIDPLFGSGGIASRQSRLGIASLILSPTSDLRETNKNRTLDISYSSPNPPYYGETIFLKMGRFRKKANIQTILYLKYCSNQSIDAFASEVGTKFGVLDEFTVILEGKGSDFPIMEESNLQGPLWRVDFPNFSDPMVDSFSRENVVILINNSHADYPSLKMETGSVNPLLKEVVASAIGVIIQKFKESDCWEQYKSEDKSFEEGSIAEAISYFERTLRLDFSSPEDISSSLRNYTDDRL